MKWLLLSRPIDWLIGTALRVRVASHQPKPAGWFRTDDRDLDTPQEPWSLTEGEDDREIEAVARAIDPADWQGFDAYVRKLGLTADERTAARHHPHGPTLPSLKRARRAIAAVEALRSEKCEAGRRDP